MKRRNNRMQGILAFKQRRENEGTSGKATPAKRYEVRIETSARMCDKLDKTMDRLMKTIEKQAKR